jgi:hypothetical protein
MAERGRNGDSTKSTEPERFADAVPPEVAGSYNFSLQTIVDLHRNFGKVENAVSNLEKTVAEQSKAIKGIETKIAWATGAFVIISALFGIAVKSGLDMLATALAKH